MRVMEAACGNSISADASVEISEETPNMEEYAQMELGRGKHAHKSNQWYVGE